MKERERRRTWRGALRSAGTAIAEVPDRLAGVLRRRGKAGRRSERKWTRRRRIAAGITVIVLLAAGVGAVALVSRARDPAREQRRLHDEAFTHLAARRYEEAAVACRRILERDGADPVARFNLGVALLQMGQAEEAWREIGAAAKDRPDFDEAHFALAQEALRRDDEETAAAELRLVTASGPVNAAAESMYAAILRRRGRDGDAIPHLAAALGDELADPLVRIECAVELGRIRGLRAVFHRAPERERQLEMDAYATARRLADAAVARCESSGAPVVPALRAARARALIALARPNDALADVDLALKSSQEPAQRAELQFLRAQVYVLAGDPGAAETELAAALAADAKPPAGAFRNVAAFYTARGSADRALDVLSRGAVLRPRDVAIALDRASLFFATGRPDDAEAECVRAAAEDPRGTQALLLAGDFRRARDDLAGARRSYEAALARDPSDVRAKLRIAGTAFTESGERLPDAAERLAEAERIAAEVLAGSPDDAGALLALGKVRLAQSKGRDSVAHRDPANAEAQKLLTRAVDADPMSVEARTFLALADYLTQNPQEAASGLVRVLQAIPDERPRLRHLLARCYLDAGMYARAADEAARAANGLPDDAEVWVTRVQAQRGASDREGALESLRRIEELRPADLRPLFDEALVLAELGRFSAAEERYAAADDRARAIAGQDERAAAESAIAEQRAYFFRLRGDLARAKATFGALVDKGPSKAAPYVRYARFLIALGQKDDAERQIERGIAVEPTSVEARRTLCEIWFSRGEATRVLVNQVQEVAQGAPRDPVVDYLRGKLAMIQGDLRVARDLLLRYAAAVPDDPDGHYALGAALGRAGEHADAVRSLERAAELVPGSPEVRVALAKVRQGWALELMRRGRVMEAQAALRRAVAEDPAARETRALLADSLRFTGDTDLSEKEVRALLHADPGDRIALRMLAGIQVSQKRLDDAAATLRKLTEVAPQDWSGWSYLSAVLVDRADLDAAEVAAKAARAAAPGEPGSLAAILHVLATRGDRSGAQREIDAAIEMSPEEPQYPCYLAMLREQEGRHEEAVAAAAKSLDLRPSNPAALQVAVTALAQGLRDTERAAAFARERFAKARDDGVMAWQLASLEADLGRRDEALRLLEPVYASDLAPVPALALHAQLLLDVRDWPAARTALAKGIAKYADAVDLHYLLAQSWLLDPAGMRDGEPQDPARGFAIAELRTVLAVAKNHAPALNNLAWLLARDEATRAEALQCAEAAVQMAPGSPVYADTLGTVLLKLGRAERAVEVLRRALGLCEAARQALQKQTGQTMSAGDLERSQTRGRRLEAVTAEIRAHYGEALKASGGR